MVPDKILTNDMNNYEIYYACVQSVEVNQSGFMRQDKKKVKTAGKG